MMETIYDMAKGRIQSLPAQHDIATPRCDSVPALAVREPYPSATVDKPQAHIFQLSRSLLSKY